LIVEVPLAAVANIVRVPELIDAVNVVFVVAV
jgi:hypothetical protein